jgi:hypothetical protein
MGELLQPWRPAKLRRYGRIGLFIGKWLMRLLSASVEMCLRHNFGRRYLRMIFLAFTFFAFCVSLAPGLTILSYAFLMNLLGLGIFHAVTVFTRRSRGAPEPHSFSAGDSWPAWQRLRLPQAVIQRWLEPALCLIASLPVSLIDPFLGLWLKASAAALFIKEQSAHWKARRRILDALDARLEAQKLNARLNLYQQKPGHGNQRAHRAQLPRRVLYPNP